MSATCPFSRDNAGCAGDRVVCRCLGVTRDEIVTVIENLGLRNVKEVRSHTGAGDGCTCCHTRIRELLQETSPRLAVAG